MIEIKPLGTFPKLSYQEAVFLAGGITDCPDWQREMVGLLSDMDVILLNPRRDNFPMDDPSAAEEQIIWEYEHLRLADAVLFWFPNATICPITLYELGAWSMKHKPIFVGVEPGYVRERDVVIQTGLVRPSVQVVSCLSDLADQVRERFA